MDKDNTVDNISNVSKFEMYLFDVDGTLTPSRGKITESMKNTLRELSQHYVLAFVSGSDIEKTREQLGDEVMSLFTYWFSQNGLVTYKHGIIFDSHSIVEYLGEERIKEFVNQTMLFLSTQHLPIKRGNFIECRESMFNVSPIGRNCSQKEREDFDAYDKVHKCRQSAIDYLKETLPDYGLTYSIGGQISFDVFPNGWDKTYCLKYLSEFKFIHFYGDKTNPGGNDFEIFNHPRTIGHPVKNSIETESKLIEILKTPMH